MQRSAWRAFLRAQLLLAIIVSAALILRASYGRVYTLPAAQPNGVGLGGLSIYMVEGSELLRGMLVARGPDGVRPLFVAPLAARVQRVSGEEPWLDGGLLRGSVLLWVRKGWLLVEPRGGSLPSSFIDHEKCISVGDIGSEDICLYQLIPPLIIWPVERGVTLLYVFAADDSYRSYVFTDNIIEKLINNTNISTRVYLMNTSSKGITERLETSPFATIRDNKVCTQVDSFSRYAVLTLLAARPGTKVILTLDGEPLYSGVIGKALIMRIVSRGQHTLCMEVSGRVYFSYTEISRELLRNGNHKGRRTFIKRFNVFRLEVAAPGIKPGSTVISEVFCTPSSAFYNPFTTPLSCNASTSMDSIYVGGEKGCSRWVFIEHLRTRYPLTFIANRTGWVHLIVELGNKTMPLRRPGLARVRLFDCFEATSKEGYDAMEFRAMLLYYLDEEITQKVIVSSSLSTSPARIVQVNASGLGAGANWFLSNRGGFIPGAVTPASGEPGSRLDALLDEFLRYIAPALLLLPEPEPVLSDMRNPMSNPLTTLPGMLTTLHGVFYLCNNSDVVYRSWLVPRPCKVSLYSGNARLPAEIAFRITYPDGYVERQVVGIRALTGGSPQLVVLFNGSVGWPSSG